MLSSRRLLLAVCVCAVMFLPVVCAPAQQTAPPLPDLPRPQMAMNEPPALPEESSSALPAAPASDKPVQSQHQKAEAQVKEEEHQRVLGIVPSFNVTYRGDAAVPLTAGQKMRLAARASYDPFAFAGAFLMAGYRETMDDNPGFGWGAEGYGKRSGAAYLDTVSSNMIGNGLYPAIFHQDPRYFRMGHGSMTRRVLYAFGMSVICKGDNGHWQPNYSNVVGNITTGALSNLYYPSGDGSGVGQTFSDGMIVTVEGGIGSIFQEIWPDISRKFFHKDPTHGLDAQYAAAEKQEQDKKAVEAVRKARQGK